MSLFAKTFLPYRSTKIKAPRVKPTVYPEYWNQIVVPASKLFETKPVLQYSDYSLLAQEENVQQQEIQQQEIQTIPVSKQDLQQLIEKEKADTEFYKGLMLGAFSMFGFMMAIGIFGIMLERKGQR